MPIWRSVAATARPPIPAPTMANVRFFADTLIRIAPANNDSCHAQMQALQHTTLVQREPRFLWRRRLAGDFFPLRMPQNLRRDAGATIGSSGRARFALDLRAVHHPARAGVERVAAVHRAAVVPKDE